MELNSNGNTLTIRTLAELIGVKYSEEQLQNCTVNRVLTQSNYVQPGDAVIAARWYPAKQTIDESLERGACVVFCEEAYARQYSDPRVLVCKDPLKCVEMFEKYCEQGCMAKRIVITGSVGKTTTTGLINSVIANTYQTLTHHSMSNSHGAILRNFQRLTPQHEFWVQEVGGVQPRYVESSAYMLHADAVVLTNIGTSHLDKYLTRENIFLDKGSLERYASWNGVVIINYDDEILRQAVYHHPVISFSIGNRSADYCAENIVITEQGTEFDLICKEGEFHIELNLYGIYNAYNALAAIAVGRWANVSMNRIIELMKTYIPSGIRQNMLNIGGYHLLVDCFNAEPRTVLGSAETLSRMKLNTAGRKIFISGHIDKLGTSSIQMHKELGHQLSKLPIDIMVFYAGDSCYTYQSLKEDGFEQAYLMDSREELDEWIRKNVKKEDIVFYKSGQFVAALAKSIDHVYGTRFQNEQQGNEGILKKEQHYSFLLRQDDIVEVSGYDGVDQNLHVPEFYNEKPVIRISTGAFRRNAQLEQIELPDSIVNIGQEAFYVCTKLKTIKFPSGLKYIHRSAFNYCTTLEEVNLPYGTLHIEMRAFRECINLKKIIIPETVGFIGFEAFEKCEKLTIYGSSGSYAEAYAKEHNIPFLSYE